MRRASWVTSACDADAARRDWRVSACAARRSSASPASTDRRVSRAARRACAARARSADARRIVAASPMAPCRRVSSSRNLRTRAMSSPAQAVGVLRARWATSSATLRSTSCPRPVSTGCGQVAMARATTSASNVARSDRAPPPRTTRTTSRSRRPSVRMAAATISGAHSPWTRASQATIRKPNPLASSSWVTSCHAALPTLVDQPDCERQHRRGQPGLRVVQPGGDEPADQLVALEGQLPQRVPGVDPAHLQAQPAAGGEEVQVAVEPDLHAVGQAQPVALQQRAELEADVGEEADRDGGADALVVIGQGEVEVAVALADALDLAPHPDALVEAAAQRAVDRLRQLGDREGREAAVVDVLEAEVEAGLAHERSGRQWVRTGTVRQYCPS